MRDFNIIQKLIGENVTEEHLAYVDCYVQENMDDIIFTQAQMRDIPELVRLRIAYMRSDYGSLSDAEFLPVL